MLRKFDAAAFAAVALDETTAHEIVHDFDQMVAEIPKRLAIFEILTIRARLAVRYIKALSE